MCKSCYCFPEVTLQRLPSDPYLHDLLFFFHFYVDDFASLKFQHCVVTCAAKKLSFAQLLLYIALNPRSLYPCLVLWHDHLFNILDTIFACVNILLLLFVLFLRWRVSYHNVKRCYKLCSRGVMKDCMCRL